MRAPRACSMSTTNQITSFRRPQQKAPSLTVIPATKLALFITIYLLTCSPITLKSQAESSSTNKTDNQQDSSKQQKFRLECEAGEQRHFNYESATKVWGPSSRQQVQLRASLRLSCMEPAGNGTQLKYLAEVLSVGADLEQQPADENEASGARAGGARSVATSAPDAAKRRADARRRAAAANLLVGLQQGARTPASAMQELRAEPVFEEMGDAISEAAERVRRSVSGWFSKTWGSVKDFIVNIFSSSERSSIGREQALEESGIDIASQCKRSKSGQEGKQQSGLPIDESVFEDLEPKYYVGASIDSLRGSAYDFEDTSSSSSSHSTGDRTEEAEEELSFFEDPRPRSTLKAHRRSKRRAGDSNDKSPGGNLIANGVGLMSYDTNRERLLRLPFVFIQSREGRILEVRFSAEESDVSVKNFKRHLCDLFATNLSNNNGTNNQINSQQEDQKVAQLVEETSPIGQHRTKYIVDPTLNATAIKQSLQASNGNQKTNEQLVKVLASHQAGEFSSGNSNHQRRVVGAANSPAASTAPVEGRDPMGANSHSDQGLSVLRSINSTNKLQLSSPAAQLPDVDRIQVRVNQVQRIAGGRMVGSAGQLGMSLLQGGGRSHAADEASPMRVARSTSGFDDASGKQATDIAELVQVSTSYVIKLVAPQKLGDFSLAAESSSRLKREAPPAAGSSKDQKPGETGAKTNNRKSQVIVRPSDKMELERTLSEWRQLESKLRLVPSSLLPEVGGKREARAERVELLRDQVQMRLNEEFMRNRLRRKLRSDTDELHMVRASSAPVQPKDGAPNEGLAQQKLDRKQEPQLHSNDLGLGLTQLVLDTGFSSKRKGSVYGTLEEILELEQSLDEDKLEGSVSRLLRDTIKLHELRAHCRSSVATVDQLRAQSGRQLAQKIQVKGPFGSDEHLSSASSDSPADETLKASRLVEKVQGRNKRKLDQCKQVLRLLVRAGDRQAAELTLDLMDECNKRLLASAQHEELGHGPASRYYRHLRQQFVELMSQMERPGDLLLDKLINRLHYKRLVEPQEKGSTSGGSHKRPTTEASEFSYVIPVSSSSDKESPTATRYNRSQLNEEDDYNNNDGAASLLMTITQLASRDSVSHRKRVEIAEKLLLTLKNSTCSVVHGPDLDIIESMGNFREPLDEMVAKVVHLARRCRHQDQYLVAAVHGLQGQLHSKLAQKFLLEQLKSTNGSCTVKSEILLTLIDALEAADIAETDRNWPRVGLNQVDEFLVELVGQGSEPRAGGSNNKRQLEADRKCLEQLVRYYLSKKRASAQPEAAQKTKRRLRDKRAIVNDDSFWDEAQCKRWAMPMATLNSSSSPGDPFADHQIASSEDMDDNSIFAALANGHDGGKSRQANGRRLNQKLIERELAADQLATTGNNGSSSTAAGAGSASWLRRRQKCVASKSFGPKSAEATLRAEVVNDLVGARDENKFLARFRLQTNFLGQKIDVGRMYLWHQRQVTRAHVNLLGKSLWDTAHSCEDKPPKQQLYMPLFDFNLWLVKVSVGLKLQSEMGFFSNCADSPGSSKRTSRQVATAGTNNGSSTSQRPLELYPTISLRASGEAAAKFVVARAGMSLASHYGYEGSIRVSQQPESCMSIYSSHQPMNVTFASWFQLWDSDCHFWGSRARGEPQATKWRLMARKPSAWLENECLINHELVASNNSNSMQQLATGNRSLQTISP